MNQYAIKHFKYKALADSCAGYKYYQGLNTYRFEIEVFRQTHRDLLKNLRSIVKPKSVSAIFNFYDMSRGRQLLAELSKNMNGYIAASVSMADRCGVLIKSHFPKSIQSEFKKSIKLELTDVFEMSLVRELRHFLSHYHIPFARPTLTTAKKGCQIYLHASDLLATRFEWAKPVKDGLRGNLSNNIDVVEMIDRHSGLVYSFNQSVLEMIVQKTKGEVEQYHAYRRAAMRSLKLAGD